MREGDNRVLRVGACKTGKHAQIGAEISGTTVPRQPVICPDFFLKIKGLQGVAAWCRERSVICLLAPPCTHDV